MERPYFMRASSQDPLEGTSSEPCVFTGVDEDSSTSLCKLPSSETEPNEHLENELSTEQTYCFRVLTHLNSLLRRYSRQIRNSVWYPLLLMIMMALPYSAGYMGCVYLDLCDECHLLALFVYLSGLFGTFIMSLHVIGIVTKRYFSPPLTGKEFDTLMISFLPILFLVLITELDLTYSCHPSFIPSDKKFCVKAFYNYAYYANFFLPIVILLLMLIHIPRYYDPSEAP